MAVALGATLLAQLQPISSADAIRRSTKSECFRRTTRITCSGLSSVSDRLRVPAGKDC